MKVVRNQFLALLQAKAAREQRTISIRTAWKESGVSKRFAYGLADGGIREFPSDALAKICTYLNCELGDLLQVVDAPTVAPLGDGQ